MAALGTGPRHLAVDVLVVVGVDVTRAAAAVRNFSGHCEWVVEFRCGDEFGFEFRRLELPRLLGWARRELGWRLI